MRYFSLSRRNRSLKALLFTQLPCRPESHHSRVNEKRSKKCLIEISRYRFSLVISGLTKILQRVNELTPSTSSQRPFQLKDQDRQESIIIVLDTLEKCLANTPKDTTKFEEAMNVKLLLREICQFIGERNNNCWGVGLAESIRIYTWAHARVKVHSWIFTDNFSQVFPTTVRRRKG